MFYFSYNLFKFISKKKKTYLNQIQLKFLYCSFSNKESHDGILAGRDLKTMINNQESTGEESVKVERGEKEEREFCSLPNTF